VHDRLVTEKIQIPYLDKERGRTVRRTYWIARAATADSEPVEARIAAAVGKGKLRRDALVSAACGGRWINTKGL